MTASPEWIEATTAQLGALKHVYAVKSFPCTNDSWGSVGTTVACVHRFGFRPKRTMSEVAHLPSLQLQVQLLCYDGLYIFFASHPDSPCEQHGMTVFGSVELIEEKRHLDEIVSTAVLSDPELYAQLNAEASFDLQAWYDGWIPVAAPHQSADVIVLDTYRRDGSEPEVIQLDHEYYFGSPVNEVAVINRWPDLASFLHALADDPCALI